MESSIPSHFIVYQMFWFFDNWTDKFIERNNINIAQPSKLRNLQKSKQRGKNLDWNFRKLKLNDFISSPRKETHKNFCTCKSLSEALIFASTNPQYDEKIVHYITSSIHENSMLKPGENMLCTEIVSDIQNNFCTQHVLPMFYKNKSF